jgi:hypothetical protein
MGTRRPGSFGREWPWGNESLDQLITRELTYIANRPIHEEDNDDFSGSNEVSDFFAKVFRFDKKEIFKVNGTVKPETTARWKFKSKVDYEELEKKIAVLRFFKPDIVDGVISRLTDSPYSWGHDG